MSEYCLRWNNHQPNLVKVFSELLTSEALVDVTLATDGHFIQAHQLVLSACSVYFKDLFMTNPCKHPIVILKDIRIEDLKTVIDFIYRGEVNVCQERLQDVLKVAGSLRIKGLAENPQSLEDFPSHAGFRTTQQASSSSSARNDLHATSQRSSLTDSREHSLSVEAEELTEGTHTSPPAIKKRKISSQESSESCSDINDDKLRLSEVKEEPRDDRENERSQSRETDPEYKVSGNGDGVEDSSSSALCGSGPVGGGNASSGEGASLIAHAQGRNKRGFLQRQSGIIREPPVEDRYEEATEYIIPDAVTVMSSCSLSTHSTNTSGPLTLLQVPAVVVSPMDSATSTPPPLHKQTSHLIPPCSGPSIITKQISHPEASIPRYGLSSNQGPPPMPKQRSHPGVLTHTTSVMSEHSTPTSKGNSSDVYQLIPLQVFAKQQKSSCINNSAASQQLRPIQPKPPEGEHSMKKDVPMIRFTPSDDGGFTVSTPHRLPRAVSEEPRHFGMESTVDLLSPGGPSPLIQSVSQDSALDSGNMGMRGLLGQPSLVGNVGLTQSSPGHCPVLREGPALGCNFCWNSSDSHGRVLRRKTKYHCPECRTNLCIVPCFHEYHKQIEHEIATTKQINKILNKPGVL